MNNYSTQLDLGSGLAFDVSGLLSNISSRHLWAALLLMAVVIGTSAFVLYYHWLRYGFGDKMVIFAQILYTVVALSGFVVMIGSIGYYG